MKVSCQPPRKEIKKFQTIYKQKVMSNPNELNPTGKKFVNELMNPDEALKEAVNQANLKKPKNDIVEKSGILLTNDGRAVLNEDKQENI
jgi:hypothetical protein